MLKKPMDLQTTHCDACKFDDALVEATSFCVSCTEYLCRMCCHDHKRNKATRSHTLLKNEEMPTDIEPFKKLHKLTRCATHPEHEIAYECVDHKTVICVACLSETHRKCEDIHDFALDSDEADAFSFNESLSRLEDVIVNNETCSKRLATGKQIMTDMHEFRRNLVSYVDRTTDKFLLDVKDSLKAEEENNKTAINDCKTIRVHIDNGNNLLKLANEHCTKRQFGVVSKYLKELNLKVEEDIDAINQLPLERLSFQENATLLTRNCIREVKLLSKWLSDSECGSDAVPTSKNVATQTDREELQVVLPAKESSDIVEKSDTITKLRNSTVDSKQNSLCKSGAYGSEKEDTPEGRLPVDLSIQNTAYKYGKFGQKIIIHRVKTKSDNKTCSVDALVALANGNIVLTDSGNAKIKLFTRSFNVLDEVRVPGNPIDMCAIGNDIYFCCSDSKKIFWQAIDGDRISARVQSYETNGQPISISKINNELVILFSDAAYDKNERGKVDLEIRSGSELCETISLRTYPSQFTYHVLKAKKIHSRPNFARSFEIILSEYNRISLYIVSRNRKELHSREWDYTPCNLQKARGIAMDSDNNVYVCGEDSNNVHQVSPLYSSLNRVIVSHVTKPISVCVDEVNKRLLVGCKNDDTVHSFSMT